MRQRDCTVEEMLARMATEAHGLVSRRVMLRDGITPAEIRSRLQSGALLPEYRGVYRVGHRAPTLESSYLAAVWACGEGAFLSGRAATYLWALIKGPPPPPQVSSPGPRKIEGIVTHRYRSMPHDEVTTCRGIPVTCVPRTLLDVAAVLHESQLARACHEAGVRYGTTPAHLQRLLARHPTTRGAHKLRAIMSGDTRVLLSELEEGFAELLRRAGLPLPETNRPAGGRRVDCRWPKYRLTVELGSFTYHNSRHSWERDLLREHEARERGDEFRRYSWGDVFERPVMVESELRPLLSEERARQVSSGDT